MTIHRKATNVRARGPLSVVCLAAVTALLAAPVATSAPIGIDAQVVDAGFESYRASFPVVEYGGRGGARRGTTRWRVVEQTGNCCENYLTSAKDGRLFDFGGTYLNFSDDRGATWKSVRPLEPLVNGEGAVVMAPGGDVVGVQWDPYSGDHLLTFKYEAAEERWLYNEMPLHQPFYDREWVGVVPGPVTFGSITAPYVSFIKGAYPSKEAWYLSFDGLNYAQVSSKEAERLLGESFDGYPQIKATPDFDWIQPNTNMGLAALGAGRAIASPDWPFEGGDWSIFDGETRRWSGFTFAEGVRPQGRMQVDSGGRLNNLIPGGHRFVYRISSDGGRTWRSTTVRLPKGTAIEEVDFRANKQVGIAAVAVHAHDSDTNKDVDLLYKLDIRRARPVLTRFYRVGRGDINSAAGLGAAIRFDFETVTILPDGRIAMSFQDSTGLAASRVTGQEQIWPSLAIEGRTSF
ncbi:MAG: hypothetical protein ABR575_04065 [Actinomycetota bacterium]